MVAVTNYRTVEMTKIYGTQTDEDTQIREDMIGQWTVMAFYPKKILFTTVFFLDPTYLIQLKF